MKLGLFHFQVLYNVLENIHFIYDERQLADAVLSKIAEALNAEGGSVFKIDPDNSIRPLASYGAPLAELKKMKFAVGRGVVGWVAQYVQPVKVDNPQKDARFMGLIDSSTGFKTKSILAAPILAKGRPVGIIEFLNRRDGPFAVPDLELISMIGREIGIAFENVALIQKIEHHRAFSEAIVNSFSAGVLVTDEKGGVLRINERGQEILELEFSEPEERLARPLGDVLALSPDLAQVMESVVKSSAPITRRELKVSLRGQDRMIGYSGVPVLGKNGERLGSALLFQDITQYVAEGGQKSAQTVS